MKQAQIFFKHKWYFFFVSSLDESPSAYRGEARVFEGANDFLSEVITTQ
jgi:hypothetical protein